ncbi:MAG: TonB-dependent receptor [Sphingomonas bacterium]|nr:TonB-dependent receptor [Sphingomonas bacterium]
MIHVPDFARRRLLAGGSLMPLALLGAGLIAPVAASAQQSAALPADGAQPAPAEEVVVTGSLLRRTNTETPSPVTVLTADGLEKGGITNISDAIRSVSADSAGSIATGFQNGFSAGGSAVSLRGLGVSSTLTLIDGLRSANFPLSDDGHNAYTDLNSVPFSTLERIEVLKDGASSSYGADAIGGVVNLITRQHFTGIDGNVEGGVSEHGDAARYRANLTAGYGNYASNGWNFYVNGEYQRDTPVFAKDRAFPYNTYDLSSIGGLDQNTQDSSLVVATTNAVVVRTTQSDLNNPLSGGLGAPLTSTYTSLNLNCANGTFTVASGAAQGTGCKHDNAYEFNQIAPKQERYSISGRLSVRLGDNIDGYVTGSYSHNDVIIDSTGATSNPGGTTGSRPIRNTQPFGASPALASSNPGIVLPVYVCSAGVNCSTAGDRRLNPNNPYAAAFANDPGNGAARIYYLFGDIPFGSERKYDVLRGTAGVHGSFGDGFDFRVDAVAVETKLTLTQHGWPNIAGLLKAINTGSYNFVNPSLNSDAVRQQVAPDITTPSYSSLYSLDASISKKVAQLQGGPLQVLIGGQIRREQLTNNNQNANLATYGLTTSSAFGKHTVSAAFFEIQAPILDQLEVNASGRYDHYSEGFSHFSPKIGFKFTPIRELAIRGTFAKGFRAPNFAENNPASSFAGFSTVTPPCSFVLAHGGTGTLSSCSPGTNPYAQAYSVGQALSGNPNLKPEKSRSFTGGVIFQPMPWLSLTVDYYNIRKTDVIVTAPLLADARAAYFAGTAPPAGYSFNTIDGPDPLFPNAQPRILIINGPYVNGASVTTSGIDFAATAKIPLAPGIRFTSRIEVTDILQYNFQSSAGAAIQRYVGTMGPYELSSGAGTPKWRGNWQNTLDFNWFSLSATAYYVSHIKNVAADEIAPVGGSIDLSCANNLYKTANTNNFCYIKSFINVDVNASFKVNDRFNFYINVMNAFGAHAPIAPSSYSGTNYLPSWHYAGIIGRSFALGANFKF